MTAVPEEDTFIQYPRREAKELLGGDLPNKLLAHFDRVWSQRVPFTVAIPVTPEVVRIPKALDEAEGHVRETAAVLLAARNHTMVTSSGVLWVVRTWADATPMETASSSEFVLPRRRLWEVAESPVLLIARMTGLGVPTYTEET